MEGVLGWENRKGGHDPGTTVGTQAADKVAKGSIAIAKSLSNFEQRAVIDKNGTQGFVTTMLGVVGLEKVVLTKEIVHGLYSEIVT